jgi:hypothetical protein
MQTGTVVLLARMKDHPEEFFGAGSHRWDRIVSDAMPYLPAEDKAALEGALSELHVNRFNERVLKRIAGEEDATSFFGTLQPAEQQMMNIQNSNWGSVLPGQAVTLTQGGWGPQIKSQT